MNLYGVLGRYIPAFGRIVGRMQYDLFHAYTVDAHTLFVVSNLRRFALPTLRPRVSGAVAPSCSALPKPELAYLAALFHDIAKGRGGDHSELGAVDAEAFCLEQGLSRYDARLVAWLVQQPPDAVGHRAEAGHLAIRRSINEFARTVGDQTHLDYLYVLTVADVRGTNPKLWNSWKASLFAEFYERVKRALRRGLESPLDQDELIAETQAPRASSCCRGGRRAPSDRRVWARFTDAYFLRHTPEEIAWHTRCSPSASPATRVRSSPCSTRRSAAAHGRRSSYTPASPAQFRPHDRRCSTSSASTSVDARITPLGDGFEPRHLSRARGRRAADHRPRPHRTRSSSSCCARCCSAPAGALPGHAPRAAPGAHVHDADADRASRDDPDADRTLVELDRGRPARAAVARSARSSGQSASTLATAKIMTVGERAEDVFFVTDHRAGRCSSRAAQLQSSWRGARRDGSMPDSPQRAPRTVP